MVTARFFVRKVGDRWVVGRDAQYFVIFDTKEGAVARANDLARLRQGEVVIEDRATAKAEKPRKS